MNKTQESLLRSANWLDRAMELVITGATMSAVINDMSAGSTSGVGSLATSTNGACLGGISGSTRFHTNDVAVSGNLFSGWIFEAMEWNQAEDVSDYLKTRSGVGCASTTNGGYVLSFDGLVDADGYPLGAAGVSATVSGISIPVRPPPDTNCVPSGTVELRLTISNNYFLVGLNDDDDDPNGTPDWQEGEVSVTNENDLVEFSISVKPSNQNAGGTLTLSNGWALADSGVRIWTASDRGTEVSLPKIWSPVSTAGELGTYYIEGTNVSELLGDNWLTLEYKAGNAKVRISHTGTVVSVKLYKDNTTWTTNAILDYPPAHLFTTNVIAGTEFEGPGGETVKLELWTSEDSGHKVTNTLTEGASGTYRNTAADDWPFFGTNFNDSAKQLKLVDEDGYLCAVPILNDTKISCCSISQKVDLAEVAAVDGTDSLDAREIYETLSGSDHYWCGIGLFDADNNPTAGTDDKIVELGGKADFLNVSGHGHSDSAEVFTSVSGYGLGGDGTSEAFTPVDIGTNWGNAELEWCLFAACSQVHFANPSAPSTNDNAVQWIKAMPNVHALLGYRDAAPSAPDDVAIASNFCGELVSWRVPLAWMRVNRDYANSDENEDGANATALVKQECDEDKMYTSDKFPTEDNGSGSTSYVYYWLEKIGSSYFIQTSTVTLP